MIVGHQVAVPGSDTPVLMPAAADMRMLADSVAKAKTQVDFLMVSFHQHWGGQEGTGQGIIPPQPPARRTSIIPADLNAARNHVNDGRKLICRAAVDAGADVILGHGNHVLNGVEIYKGKPILYSLGHFYIEGMKDGRALPQFFFSPTMVAQIENGWWLEEQRWSAIARLFVQGRPGDEAGSGAGDDGHPEGWPAVVRRRRRCRSESSAPCRHSRSRSAPTCDRAAGTQRWGWGRISR